MTERPKFFDDIAGVAGGALSALTGLKDEMAALVRARVDEAVRRLDLVKREEFEAVAELARRAREQAEALELRVLALEQAPHASAAAQPPVSEVSPQAIVDPDRGAEPDTF